VPPPAGLRDRRLECIHLLRHSVAAALDELVRFEEPIPMDVSPERRPNDDVGVARVLGREVTPEEMDRQVRGLARVGLAEVGRVCQGSLPVEVHRDDDVGYVTDGRDGDRHREPGVREQPPLDLHGTEHAGDGDARPDRQGRRALAEHDRLTGAKVSRDDGERRRAVLEPQIPDVVVDEPLEPDALQQPEPQ
jgi:hypothetical protein